MAMANMMPMMTITIIISMRVKPFRRMRVPAGSG
jgi:hypothetical protein